MAPNPLVITSKKCPVFAARSALPRDIDDLPRLERVHELVHGFRFELWVARLDDEEEAVARGVLETLYVEHRVIRHRKAIQGEHAEDGAKRGEQDRALERD